ncbi:MAG: antibiotic biosynthesis monooxygenase family protein [Gammaproteobacteria bacterium]
MAKFPGVDEMILEQALLPVILDQEAKFEPDFSEAEKIIGAAKGYLGHKLIRCVENPSTICC